MNLACINDSNTVTHQMEILFKEYGEKNNILINCDYYQNAQKLLDGLEQKQYDIVFVDAYFKNQEMNGIELARDIWQKDPTHMIVFLASSAEYMKEAFAVHAFSYVLKDNLAIQLERVMDDAVKILSVTKKLTIRIGKQEYKIPQDKIICACTEGHYINIRIQDGKPVRTRMTFRDLLDQIDQEERFLQINRGILVNMDHIRDFEEGNISMDDGTWLPVRHRGRTKIIADWRTYQLHS